jgi:hypothetical protein
MSKMGTNGRVYSSRDRLNVIMGFRNGDGQGNHFFPPARGHVTEYVRECIEAAVEEQGRRFGGWATRPYTVTIRPDVERGAYSFSVWMD